MGAILAAAEEAAEQIRADAEARMDERIAEGRRAADNRVRAADEEAAEVLSEARSKAEKLVSDARAEADSERSRAATEALETLGRAQEEADRMGEEAEAASSEQIRRSRQDAQDLITQARAAADGVQSRGTEISQNLEQLSGSLRTNAERLLRDVRQAHDALVRELDDAAPERATAPRRRPSGVPSDLEVPEFTPRAR